MTACPGPENRRWRDALAAWNQALADYDPLDSAQSRPEPPPDPRPGDPVWCADCASRIRARLAELDDLAALLAATADGYRPAAAGDRVPGSGDPVSPSRAADDLDELTSMLTGWESAYRDEMGWPSPAPRGDLASVQTTCIAWLGQHLTAILASCIGGDFGTEILQWHREFTAGTKAGARTLRKPLRCPSCRMFTLLWTEGDKNVICGSPDCGRILSLAEYEAELERLAKEQRVA